VTGPKHRGVGIVATNRDRTRFLVQQKDEHYVPHPRGYSFFGGACEHGESAKAALTRELREELPESSAQMLLDASPREVGSYRVGPTAFSFLLFEAVVPDSVLDALAQSPVLEGERAAVVSRDALIELPFVWDLLEVVIDYLAD